MAHATARRRTLDRILRSIPVIGLLHRILEEERVGDLMLLVLNIVMVVVLATLVGGWGAFITIATAAAGFVLFALILVTAG